MCRTFLTLGAMPMPEELGLRGETPRFVDVGKPTSIAIRRWGRGGLGIEWSQMDFGLRGGTGGIMSHAHLDRMEMVWGYEKVVPNLCAVPLYGYRWRGSSEWTRVSAGWALGSFDPASGFLLFSAGDEPAQPIVAAWDDARRWLLSDRREQVRLLRGFASDAARSTLVEAGSA